jgi:glycosyltransferase involved in cell wall biosynthesis
MQSVEQSKTAENLPLVSIIIPCRNEGEFIGPCLESILANDYPKDRLEVLVVDGMSDDDTRARAEEYAQRYPFIRVLENPRRTAPAALNIGLAQARGEVIMRMDAHSEYVRDYISRLVLALEESGADNVGGRYATRPGDNSAVAAAIALALSHPFGVGNAYYRLEVSERREVDTVPYGCYRREVFQRLGGFDEELIRNQDLEFNLRLRRQGGKILLVPDVVCYYRARRSLAKFAYMNFLNGYFNPLVARKVGGRMGVRQWATPLFVLTLVCCVILALWWPWARWLLLGVIAAYLIPVAVLAFTALWRHGLGAALWMPLVLPSLHLGNGVGFLKGFWDFFILRRKIPPLGSNVPITR